MNSFKIPVFEYIKNGSNYSGSKRGTKLDGFNFEIMNRKDSLEVFIWYGIKYRAISDIVDTQSFDMSEDGYNLAVAFVDSSFDVWLESHEVLDMHRGIYSK